MADEIEIPGQGALVVWICHKSELDVQSNFKQIPSGVRLDCSKRL